MDHLPVFLNVAGRHVIVAGNATVAARRVDLALKAGARVTVFAEDPCDDLRSRIDETGIAHQARMIERSDLKDCVLVYGACGDAERDARVHRLAKQAGVPVNIADAPGMCDFIMPSIVDRSPLVIAISSSGRAPILARILKARLETMVPAAYGALARFAGGFREQVMKRLKKPASRRHFWERAIEGSVAGLVLAGDERRATAQLLSQLDAAAIDEDRPAAGEVYLVGAGPGDPDLLTFRALRLMQRADVVLYDRLIGDGILNLVRRDARRIYVGKLPRQHTMAQDELCRLLVRLAREGKRVLRLKGGDPFIFGRGGEEIETLAAQGIAFQVVPGVTAASGCAAYAGIPLTHRDHAQACIFVTAHGKDGVLNLDWDLLLRPGQTVAVYMGLSSLAQLADGFLAHGADPDLPVAIVENGTLATQKIVTGNLANIRSSAEAAALAGPAMIIVGTVVRLHGALNWYAPGGEDDGEADAGRERISL